MNSIEVYKRLNSLVLPYIQKSGTNGRARLEIHDFIRKTIGDDGVAEFPAWLATKISAKVLYVHGTGRIKPVMETIPPNDYL